MPYDSAVDLMSATYVGWPPTAARSEVRVCVKGIGSGKEIAHV